MSFKAFILSQIKNSQNLLKHLAKVSDKEYSKQTWSTVNTVSNKQVILLDYPVNSRQRWTKADPNQHIYKIINENRNYYKFQLEAFLELSEYYIAIPKQHEDNFISNQPCWVNGWMPALDGVALYGFIVKHKPKLYIEVGSGNSTKVAHLAIAGP